MPVKVCEILRLFAIFWTLTADARCRAYRDKLSGELAKLEQQQRMAQLSERRSALAAERRATGSALAALSSPPSEAEVTAAGGGALRTALIDAALAGEKEREAIASELRRVRGEYDVAKWKGRWSG